MSPQWTGPDDAPSAVDLYAGCGGMTFGLFLAGFHVRAAWEIRAPERYTYHVQHCQGNDLAQYGDATNVDPSKVPDDLSVLAGGPSCQGWSAAGGTVDPDDPRNEHAFSMVRWADACEPQLVLVENVVGMTELHGPLHSALVDELEEAGPGYEVRTLELNAADYGVPQRRKRVFIVGVRDGLPTPGTWTPPATHRDGQRQLLEFSNGRTLTGYTTAREAFDNGGDGPLPRPLESQSPADDPVHATIDDLVAYRDDPTDRHRVDPHSVSEFIERDGAEVWMPPNHVEIDHDRETRAGMAEWPLGFCGSSTTDRRLHPDEPAPTMTVSQGTPPVHFSGRSPADPHGSIDAVRRLTVREVARLQTFPDSYAFAGTKTEQYRQAGNAVPPLVAATVATHLREQVLEASSVTDEQREVPA
ncbi:DNA cytosine methyltransferase [Natronorubrum daqingense]|uniref:DNA (cytosine-5-)-methyltransferase n=2 Tax=Natronorubrum daqingense TaxID=588898 RepID=A0A1N7G122_9EURY|nr:DNA cytosine methyltransferase [Natronorubrum daqingense]SIS06267.1 DNA (cytosine-5)-methyltransferase 1 [Natronorubrum daqingense]